MLLYLTLIIVSRIIKLLAFTMFRCKKQIRTTSRKEKVRIMFVNYYCCKSRKLLHVGFQSLSVYSVPSAFISVVCTVSV